MNMSYPDFGPELNSTLNKSTKHCPVKLVMLGQTARNNMVTTPYMNKPIDLFFGVGLQSHSTSAISCIVLLIEKTGYCG